MFFTVNCKYLLCWEFENMYRDSFRPMAHGYKMYGVYNIHPTVVKHIKLWYLSKKKCVHYDFWRAAGYLQVHKMDFAFLLTYIKYFLNCHAGGLQSSNLQNVGQFQYFTFSRPILTTTL